MLLRVVVIFGYGIGIEGGRIGVVIFLFVTFFFIFIVDKDRVFIIINIKGIYEKY